jgi:hypothetical protein
MYHNNYIPHARHIYTCTIIHTHIYTLIKIVLSGKFNNPDLIAAIVGGVVGGLIVILLIALFGFGIATAVILSLRKRGEYHS